MKTRWSTPLAVGVTAVALSLTGCSATKDAVSTATEKAKQTSSSADQQVGSGSSSSSSTDEPIGSDGFDMPSSSNAKEYPKEQVSGPGAGDCYASGSRIYDRSGITCADAKTVKAAYEATSASKDGKTTTVKGYECSHNPEIMVNQGAAPAKCTDKDGTVVFNWRYPGAPTVEK